METFYLILVGQCRFCLLLLEINHLIKICGYMKISGRLTSFTQFLTKKDSYLSETHLTHSRKFQITHNVMDEKCFPDGSVGKESTWNAADIGDAGFIPGRSPGGGNGNPLQYSWLKNPMDKGDWWATVHGALKNQTRLSNHAHVDWWEQDGARLWKGQGHNHKNSAFLDAFDFPYLCNSNFSKSHLVFIPHHLWSGSHNHPQFPEPHLFQSHQTHIRADQQTIWSCLPVSPAWISRKLLNTWPSAVVSVVSSWGRPPEFATKFNAYYLCDFAQMISRAKIEYYNRSVFVKAKGDNSGKGINNLQLCQAYG